MRSSTVKRIINNTYRKSIYDVDAYVGLYIEGIKKRFHYKFSWKDFNIGFGFCKTTGISGWTYRLSVDLGFYSCWIYFVEFKKQTNENT